MSDLNEHHENWFRFNNIKSLRFTLPIVFVLFFVSQVSPAARMIVFLVANLPFHELGHAVGAWLGGRLALPLPMFGFAYIQYSRSSPFMLLVFLALGIGLYLADKHKKSFNFYALLAATVFAAYSSFMISEMKLSMFISFAGVLGEVILGALFVILFFHPISYRIRWDFWRFPLLFLGGFSYLNAADMWWKISKGKEEMPMGSAISSSQNDGDLNKLIAAGFTEQEILTTMMLVIKVCGGLILLQYVYSLIVSQSKTNFFKNNTLR